MKYLVLSICLTLAYCSDVLCQNTVEVKDEISALAENFERSIMGGALSSEYTIVRSQLESGNVYEIIKGDTTKVIMMLSYDNKWSVQTISYRFGGEQMHNYIVRRASKKKLEFTLYAIGERRFYESIYGTVKRIPSKIFEEIVVSLSYAMEYK